MENGVLVNAEHPKLDGEWVGFGEGVLVEEILTK